MANKNIFDATLEITKVSVEGGVIKALEINGADIPLAQDLEDNKAVTIDVSDYTEPVVINPTSGKDGMKKATVTLSNIPSSDFDASLLDFEKSDSEGVSGLSLIVDLTTGSEVDKFFYTIVSYNGEVLGYIITGTKAAVVP